MKSKFPETSLEAYEKVSDVMLSNHHKLILETLKILKKATSEQIADYLNWDDKNRAARRMKELETKDLIYKTGEKKQTKYGRNAFVYSLVKSDNAILSMTLF